jgi:CubicO group peptidase (beta-lactamase class C family)
MTDGTSTRCGVTCHRHGGPNKGTIKSITQFDHRVAPPGTKYHYASIGADVLGVVPQYAVKKSLSAYLQERVWQPIGAEADAKWLLDAEGLDVLISASTRFCAITPASPASSHTMAPASRSRSFRHSG